MNKEDLDLSRNTIRLIDKQLSHPGDVVSDPNLSISEKGALLAAWASDAHAVPDAPTLRQLDNGAVVSLTTILDALNELDGLEGRKAAGLKDCGYTGRRHDDILTRWRKRPLWRRRRRDDDDEPPPLPAALSVRGLNPIWA